MKILITGANGMVARAVIKHCIKNNEDVIALTKQELNITEKTQINKSFTELKPDILINCAAYTDVDKAETNTDLCYAVNAFGVENLASACKAFNTRFVTISTDYVFDGEKSDFYTEEDKPNPQGVYAKAKLLGEELAQKTNENSIIVRSGWIYGDYGTNFLSVVHQLLAEKSIKAIDDAFGTPTFAKDLAYRLRELAELNNPGIYHVTNEGNGTSYYGFAKEVAQIKGFDENLIERVSNIELKRPAPRPKNSRLASIKLKERGFSPLQKWKAALSEFLESN